MLFRSPPSPSSRRAPLSLSRRQIPALPRLPTAHRTLKHDLRELIALNALNSAVENEHVSVVGRLEDEDVLVETLLHVKDLLDPEGHRLTCSQEVALAPHSDLSLRA